MDLNTFTSYELTDIPNDPGIYSFRTKIVSLESVGLIGNSNFNDESLLRAKEKVRERLINIDNLYASRRLIGKAQEPSKTSHLAKTLLLEIDEDSSLVSDDLNKKLSNVTDIYKLVKLLNILTLALPPLYVGITVDQTLAARYIQHQRDFDAKSKGCFGGRVAQSGIRWTDLDFSAIRLPTSIIDRSCMEFAEYILHALNKPLFSNS